MLSSMPSCLRLCSLSTLLLLASCADNPSAAQAPSDTQAPVATAVLAPAIETSPIALPGPVSFAAWLAGFRSKALAAGIEAPLLERVFAGLTPDPAVIDADRSQPEFSRPVWEYLEGALSPTRARKGT